MGYTDFILNKLCEKFNEFETDFSNAVDEAKEKGKRLSPPDWLKFEKKLFDLYKGVPFIINCGLVDNMDEWKDFQEEFLPKIKLWVDTLNRKDVKPTFNEMAKWSLDQITDPKLIQKFKELIKLEEEIVQKDKNIKSEKASEEDWD